MRAAWCSRIAANAFEGIENMDKTEITKFKWFWAWQGEAEEAWLEEMSQKGYHLSSVGLPGFYTFSTGDPRHYTYHLDFRVFQKKDGADYLQRFEEAGWEYLRQVSAWQYFRKEVAGEAPIEGFTDVDSRISRYKRVLTHMAFLYFILWAILGGRVAVESPYPWWINIPHIIILFVLLLLTYAIVMIVIRMRKLDRYRPANPHKSG